MNLPAASFQRAREFLKTRSRPLERTMFEAEFEGGSPARAVSELQRYQNQDGGFGNMARQNQSGYANDALIEQTDSTTVHNAEPCGACQGGHTRRYDPDKDGDTPLMHGEGP